MRVTDCEVEIPTMPPSVILQEFFIQLNCLNPFWREPNESSANIAYWVGDFHFPLVIPHDTGIMFGHRQPSLIVNVRNNGDVPTGMRIEFRALGIVVNPSLFNIETRRFIQFNNLTLNAGDILTVNTNFGQKAVTLRREQQTTNAFRYIDIDSTYMQLEPGDNHFRYNAEANLDNLEVYIFYYNRYLGV